MVLPKKKTQLTKEEQQLKKKLKKLFKDEDLNYNNVTPTTSQFIKYENSEMSMNNNTKSNSNMKKSNSADTKRSAAPLKNLPIKKVKKTTTKAYYEQEEELSYETESSPTCGDTSHECCNCAKSYSSVHTNESNEGKNCKSKTSNTGKRQSNQTNGYCYNSDTENSEEFEKLKKLATKELIKLGTNKSKIKPIKSNVNSSYSDEQQIEKKTNNNKIVNSKKLTKKKQSIKSENKTNKIKNSCKDYNDSSEYITDDSNDESGATGRCRKLNGNKKSRKLNNQIDNWKTESISETKSEHDYSNEQVDTNNVIDDNVNKSLEVDMEKEEKNYMPSKVNGNIKNKSKKSKKTHKNKEKNNQKLIPYRHNSNLPDNDSNDSAEENLNEIMKFYGIESTDDEEDIGEVEETEGEYSFSNSGEYDSEETEGNSCEEEDYDSEYSSDHNDSDDYNFETATDDDEDYNLPEYYEEDLYIPQGIATKYDINSSYDIEFDSENEAQIIEIPTENIEKSYEKNIENEISSIQNYESDDSCPQLIPISFENQTSKNDLENNYDDYTTDTDDYSESDYSEATEGSLCFENNLKDLKQPEEATAMLPEIFDLSSENLQNSYSILNQLDNCVNKDDDDVSELEFDNPLEKIINNSNISNSSTSYKITTIGGVEVNMTSSKVSQQLLRKSIKNNISNEITTNNNNLDKLETKFYNAIDSCHVLVLLRDPIYIYGTIKLKLIIGNIEIFGYQPDLNETLEIFSPRGYSFLDIKSIKNQNNIDKKYLENIIFQDNYESIFLKFDLNDIIKNFNLKTDALILLKRNDCNKKIEMLRKYMKENLFPNMNSITLDRPFYSSEFILHCLIRIQPLNPIHIDPKWQTIQLNSNTKSMIIGGKSVGKSTLIRYLINKNLKIFKKIILIDLDIGQPELFIPQTISACILDCPLLGPGYYLGIEPKKSLLFGDINAILSPIDYLKNIQILLKYCQENDEFQNIPWIINTMGYVKGFGNELIAAIIKYLQPTDIIQLQSSKLVNNFDYLMYPNVVQTIPMNVYSENDLNINDTKLNHRLIVFDSIMNGRYKSKTSEWDMNSKDMRYAMIVTRFGAALNKSDWLTDVKPICAPMDDIEIISFGEDYLTKEELLDVINANVVYLCNKSTNNHIDCYGIGIVRGIDRLHRKIYLLPAAPIEVLTNVNCLAICNIPLPTSILLNQGPKIKGIVPYAYNTNKVIASKSIHQLYNRGQKRRSEI